MLTDDLTFSFLPSPDASSYILSIEEIGIPGNRKMNCPYPLPAPHRQAHSSVSITDAEYGKLVTYPKERIIRSLIVRVQKSSLGHLIHDFDAGAIATILQSANRVSSISWPITSNTAS